MIAPHSLLGRPPHGVPGAVFERLRRMFDEVYPVELPEGVIGGPTRRITEERQTS
jgi:hypothetical protein